MLSKRYSEDIKAAARKRYAEGGVSLNQVAREFGATRTAVTGWCVESIRQRRLATAKEKRSNPAYSERLRDADRRCDEKQWACNPEKQWANHAFSKIKKRAKDAGLPFDLTKDDLIAALPTDLICPVLGVKMEFNGRIGERHKTISVDRIKPNDGYTKGNIAIISYRANAMKQDATAGEVLSLYNWMKGRTCA